MISVSDAERIITAHVKDVGDSSCPLAEAQGRILRETIRADRDYPPCDRSTVDGIAIARAAVAAGQRSFRVEHTLQAGRPARGLKDPAGGCIRIMTGAVVPPGIDRIIPVEHLTERCTIVHRSVRGAEGQNIHWRGSDGRKGDALLRPGCILSGARIAVIASTGRKTVRVARVPSIALISTGDELVDVGRPAKPWQIRCSNAYGIRATLLRNGYSGIAVFHVKDRRDEVRNVFAEALRAFDVVITTGGVSMGDFDFVPEVLRELKIRTLFHTVRQKPGKPFWFGVSRKHQPVFALPGNPVSSMVCLHRYVLPGLTHAMGLRSGPVLLATLSRSHAPHARLTLFLPVRIESKGGQRLAHPERYGGSGDLVALGTSDGFIELPRGRRRLSAGANVTYRAWT
ncbi:MAG: molybdopterin molybdotransferase MoeA [bacterium]